MKSLTHRKGDAESIALYFGDDHYRCSLTHSRAWAAACYTPCSPIAPQPGAITIRQPGAVSPREYPGGGAMALASVFAFRLTGPQALREAASPVGPDNDAVLQDAVLWADQVICVRAAMMHFGL